MKIFFFIVVFFPLFLLADDLKISRNNSYYLNLQSPFHRSALMNVLEKLWAENEQGYFSGFSYERGPGSFAYFEIYSGIGFDPTHLRLVFVPGTQAAHDHWQYYDLQTQQLVSYAHGFGSNSSQFNATPTYGGAYYGSVYDPVNNHLIFVPHNNTNQRPNWHYYDCNTGTIQSYAHGQTLVAGHNGYAGGVYDPYQNRIIFIPANYAYRASNWHYYDCDTQTVGSYNAYQNGIGQGDFHTGRAYMGGVYDPSGKIIFVPNTQTLQSHFHYYDCHNPSAPIVRYTHGATFSALVNNDEGSYSGGSYDPVSHRIVFTPNQQGNQTHWHYYDCDTGTIQAYAHGQTGVTQFAYQGSAYHPIENKIFFIPYNQGNAGPHEWHYYDCASASIKAYQHGQGAFSGAAQRFYAGGIYEPYTNRIFFAPSYQGQQSHWHGIRTLNNSQPLELGSHYLFNKF